MPHAVNAFDSARPLCVGEVIFSDAGTTVIMKWSKTIQDRVSSSTITFPSVGTFPSTFQYHLTA